MDSPQNENAAEKVTPKKKDTPVATELLQLFLQQKLEVAGDLFVKPSRFQRSKKYHVELREATMVVFRSAEIARSESVGIEDVVSVFSVPKYLFDVVQKDDNYPRIFIAWSPKHNDTIMYIKVMGGEKELDAWRYGLGRATMCPLPCLRDLTIESVIGRGGGGKVFMVSWQHGDTHSTYALKVIEKTQAFKNAKSFRHVSSERRLMAKVGQHPFLLRMQFAFQTEKNLFIGTPFCAGGDLASYLRAKGDRTFPCQTIELAGLCLKDQRRRRVYGRLSELQTRMIAAEIILGLEHLHQQGIVYRDLKPENIFIDSTGHVKIGDYGLAKFLGAIDPDRELPRTTSVCGTRNYLPPEMLFGRSYSYEADLWSLGVMLYRILCGALPFEAARSRDLFYKVKVLDPVMPSWLSPGSSQLLIGLLEKDPKKRLTIATIKRHTFFEEMNWEDVFYRRAGRSIPDFEPSSGSFDPLDNFELSKLQGITVGEYDVGVEGETNEANSLVPTHQQNARDMVIGFEYCCPLIDEDELAPLRVNRKSGGIFSKMASIDTAAFFPRRSSSEATGFLAKLGSLDIGKPLRSPKSPRGIQQENLHNR